MSDLSFGDRIVALAIAAVCVLMMLGVRVLCTPPGGRPSPVAHGYMP